MYRLLSFEETRTPIISTLPMRKKKKKMKLLGTKNDPLALLGNLISSTFKLKSIILQNSISPADKLETLICLSAYLTPTAIAQIK